MTLNDKQAQAFMQAQSDTLKQQRNAGMDEVSTLRGMLAAEQIKSAELERKVAELERQLSCHTDGTPELGDVAQD